ncbi:MAG: Asp-tRNA(Asn)/Glu-tRNA(Gln) amidotransferase subunit GatC [Candidatus Korarchaeota archaeon]
MLKEDDIFKLAKLARIEITNEKANYYLKEINRVLEFFDILSDIPPAENTVIFWVPGETRDDVPIYPDETDSMKREKDGHVKTWPL